MGTGQRAYCHTIIYKELQKYNVKFAESESIREEKRENFNGQKWIRCGFCAQEWFLWITSVNTKPVRNKLFTFVFIIQQYVLYPGRYLYSNYNQQSRKKEIFSRIARPVYSVIPNADKIFLLGDFNARRGQLHYTLLKVLGNFGMRKTNTNAYLSIFANPSTRAGYDTRSFFKRSLTGEMQSVSCSIWTRVAVSISYDDNYYTTGINGYLSARTPDGLCQYQIQTSVNSQDLMDAQKIQILAPRRPYHHTTAWAVRFSEHKSDERSQLQYWPCYDQVRNQTSS